MPKRDDALYRAAQVRELDRVAIAEHGIPGFTLMRRAAAAVWREARALRRDAGDRSDPCQVWIFCGTGNNGGDGFEVGRLALADGNDVSLYLVGDAERIRDDARSAYDNFVDAGGQVQVFTASVEPLRIGADDLVVDALLGTGLDRETDGDMADAIGRINTAHRCGTAVIAVDVPSGLHADTGRRLGATVEADVTVSFIGNKLGLFTGAGAACAGRRVFADLGVPDAVYRGAEASAATRPAATLIAADFVARQLPTRPRDAFKNKHGHVLVIGGDVGMGGAIRLTAEAALRCGAGLVTVATQSMHAAAMTQACPSLMCHGVESAAQLVDLIDAATVIAMGPGLGTTAWGRELFAGLFDALAARESSHPSTKSNPARSKSSLSSNARPIVLDADGLNLLAERTATTTPVAASLGVPLADGWILTPHPGEAARLLDCSTRDIEHDRPAAVRQLRDTYGGVAVLKGAGTLICDSVGQLQVCRRGNPGMAVAGMGDVLTGVIAALLAQGLSVDDAAVAGVDLHAAAGDRAAGAGQRGMIATDLFAHLRVLANASQ